MKKAKMILAAIAVFAVVGGVYATKARQSQFVYVPGVGGLCTSTLYGYTFQPGGRTFNASASSTTTIACPITVYYSGN